MTVTGPPHLDTLLTSPLLLEFSTKYTLVASTRIPLGLCKGPFTRTAGPPTHDPFWQASVCPLQTLPHEPQFLMSTSSSTHSFSAVHALGVRGGHVHRPSWHVWPGMVHALPQVPQFLRSFCVSRQAPPHTLPPFEHSHWALTHC